ncbi:MULTISPECIES: DUF5993 family protein [unclassified Bosea (in: a-proteobacteria)]|uniref:DUF5993 family protein n=1 Tax=unclassified Bosea (in: a-proteobacteria) TaxID=2653178 RepID=UPI0009541FCF|nr:MULTISPECIES: DUF5993 family protein [unclassified Bosea (in: a-proteobacteria)]SIP90590.1 hypothetical protein SAMN05880592_101115 [Bosea sp. TND4EK4]
MMSLPFFGLLAGFGCVATGRRRAALLLWALSMLVMLGLFRLHVTDALTIVL